MKYSIMIFAMLSVLVFTVSCSTDGEKNGPGTPGNMSNSSLSGKKVLMIIASQDFRDEEYREPRTLLEKLGATVTVASSSTEESIGMLGKEKVMPDLLLSEVDASKYDAIIFVGGLGASEYFGSETAHKIAKAAVTEKKILAAICIAPNILANAGVLKDKKATVWGGPTEQFKKSGADFEKKDVAVDGLIITANGPEAAKQFAEEIVKALSGK